MSQLQAQSSSPIGLYVHFPWCVSKCPYCDFNSHALREDIPGRDTVPEATYLKALQHDLLQQLELQAKSLADRKIATIFMGGGTPSLFSPTAIGKLLEWVRSSIGFMPDVEITLEANPGMIERGRFGEYAAVGVNRVSLGAQSFNAVALRVLGRIHSPAETLVAANELHAAGLDNFNIDLMYGLPAQDAAGALYDVETAIALGPAQISHYQLTLEPGTSFAGRPPADLPSDDQTERMLALCGARLTAAGYAQYEVSAWARKGRACAHNLNYWRFGDYLGIGAGAHGKLTGSAIWRSTQQRDPRRYQRDPIGGLIWQQIATDQLPFEFMLNVLRLLEGFERGLFESRTGLPWSSVDAAVVSLLGRGLLALTDGVELATTRIQPTVLGVRFLNEVLLEFLPERAESMHNG
ncbi:MAG: radical SAM family heme chaperone HemW [Gammaproteobacteria bacterium]|nr:radical SAM family heme chaperone HemW [Gammaproteobacteria bacterium]